MEQMIRADYIISIILLGVYKLLANSFVEQNK